MMKNKDISDKPGYSLSRRNLLSFLGVLPFAPRMLTHMSESQYSAQKVLLNEDTLPSKKLFAIKGTFLNAAYTHPMSIGSAESIKSYLNLRLANGKAADTIDEDRNTARTLFARLINADADEISWVSSTMAGENLVVNGLGLPGTGARIVTDAYHFDGSLYMYNELAKQGADVKIVIPKNNKINLADMDAAIKPGTKLVAISLVSMINGFQHDLKALCNIAHARGALVYADIIQAAGAVPIDVHDSGVDFCACATYKWLMGDFGAGFLYVRKDRLPLIKRSQFGYRQLKDMKSHIFPYDSAGNSPFEFIQGEKTRNYFEVGTLGNAAVPALIFSLNYLLHTSVDKIQNYRQPMIDKLQQELARLGYQPMTPRESTSPIVSFALEGAEKKLHQKLATAGINIQLYENRFRISPSVYNTMSDIDHLINVLS
ncbi:aminotransferase class V-fold PLP-dependent enzyme [Mucilaginibacter sp.]|uniref:aminotransferase class V-fold PLP-dependent enzyme n=1 Tax=Mucilaginibacter sp. TaxID=1882438 RepID=UPI0025F40CC1|nr:aminotransferase class V-fold PLP-dependent enzyme [Mucilaginibacter sp.]